MLTKKVWIVCSLGLLLSACGAADPPEDFERGILDAPGPHGIGYRESSVTYVPRDESASRTLRLAIWYPTDATRGNASTYNNMVDRPQVFQDASLSASGHFPVMVFSHGMTGFAEVSYFLAEHFASHGYVVVAPDHTGDTLSFEAYVRSPEIYRWRPQDVSAALDAIYDAPVGDPLAGRVAHWVGAVGHSFGGYTVMLAAGGTPAKESNLDLSGYKDDRIQAVVAIEPGNFDLLDTKKLRAAYQLPLALIQGDMSRAIGSNAYWEILQGLSNARRLHIARAGHHSFTAVCELLPSLGSNDGCGPEFMSPDDVHTISQNYILAFMEMARTKATDARALLSKIETKTQEVYVER